MKHVDTPFILLMVAGIIASTIAITASLTSGKKQPAQLLEKCAHWGVTENHLSECARAIKPASEEPVLCINANGAGFGLPIK